MVRLTSKSVMAIQNACRANAFTIMSTGVSTLRILRIRYARVLLISISEGRMRTPTRRSHPALPPIHGRSFQPFVLDRRQHEEVYPRASAEPGDRGRL